MIVVFHVCDRVLSLFDSDLSLFDSEVSGFLKSLNRSRNSMPPPTNVWSCHYVPASITLSALLQYLEHMKWSFNQVTVQYPNATVDRFIRALHQSMPSHWTDIDLK
eukprot:79172_1